MLFVHLQKTLQKDFKHVTSDLTSTFLLPLKYPYKVDLPIIHVVYYMIAQAAQLFPLPHVFGAIPWLLLHYKLWCCFSSLRSLLMLLQSCCVWLRPTSEHTLLQRRLFSWLMCTEMWGYTLQSVAERTGPHQKHNRAFSQQRWSFITVDCQTHSYKNPMHYLWKKRHTLWLVQTVLSQHQDEVLQLLMCCP